MIEQYEFKAALCENCHHVIISRSRKETTRCDCGIYEVSGGQKNMRICRGPWNGAKHVMAIYTGLPGQACSSSFDFEDLLRDEFEGHNKLKCCPKWRFPGKIREVGTDWKEN